MKPFYILIIALIIVSCSQPTEKADTNSPTKIPGVMLADTISYPVVIKNPDSTDTWTDDCLRPLNRAKLADMVFEAIYNNKAQAYSYLADKPLSVSYIKELEQQDEYSRDKVGKLQFWESWYFDEKKQVFTKKVHKILVAYEALTESGELRNYRAAFYIKLKQ
jgi:hypothetical protein